MKNQKGITLIALVVTIIVLLILAGVSIAMLTGDNGILTNSTKASFDTEKAEAIEKINMELNSIKTTALSNIVDDSTYDAATGITKVNGVDTANSTILINQVVSELGNKAIAKAYADANTDEKAAKAYFVSTTTVSGNTVLQIEYRTDTFYKSAGNKSVKGHIVLTDNDLSIVGATLQ